MPTPLVSVVCLCYNHARFVEEALNSVINQTYRSVELIVVDDASSDESVSIIKQVIGKHSEIKLIRLKENVGNCKAFNIGLKECVGKYVIDFATDDVMVSSRIAKQVDFFESLNDKVGVVFTDATYMDSSNQFIKHHFDYLFSKKLLSHIPEGEVFRDVLTTYFIPSPTMMIRKSILDLIQGYDEGLSYEDFDFWVRSSKVCEYRFLNERLTKIRKTENSMSSGWYKKGDKQLYSTYLICKKAVSLCDGKDDLVALAVRVRYELRQSVFSDNREEAKLFYSLLSELEKVTIWDYLIFGVNMLRIPLRSLRNLYHNLAFK